MRVSLCMIVRDEAANLLPCLGSAAGLVDEAVVVDTGSVDATRAIALRAGVRLVDAPWEDDFAAARNVALDHASGDWIVWLDADDRLDAANRARLGALIDGLKDEHVGYAMKCACPSSSGLTVVDHVRLFRRRPDVRWEGRIHEQIAPSIVRTGGRLASADVVIDHLGYTDASIHRQKLERNVRIALYASQERPDDPLAAFHLGWSYLAVGRALESLPPLRRAVEGLVGHEPYLRKVYGQVARACHALGRRDEALAACREGLGRCPESAELRFFEAMILGERGDHAGAETALRILLTPGAPRIADDPGLLGYKARHNLGLMVLQQGRVEEAVALWRAVLAERPDFAPALRALEALAGPR